MLFDDSDDEYEFFHGSNLDVSVHVGSATVTIVTVTSLVGVTWM